MTDENDLSVVITIDGHFENYSDEQVIEKIRYCAKLDKNIGQLPEIDNFLNENACNTKQIRETLLNGKCTAVEPERGIPSSRHITCGMRLADTGEFLHVRAYINLQKGEILLSDAFMHTYLKS